MNTLSEKMQECITIAKPIRKKYDLNRDYVALLMNKGLFAVPVDEVFSDGFLSDGVHYPFIPFTAITEDVAQGIVAQTKDRRKEKIH